MPYEKLIAKLKAVAGLSETNCAALTSMPYTAKILADGEYILREGARASHCVIVEKGFLFREKIVGSRAQILSLHVAGDMPDLHTLHLPVMDHDLRSAGPSSVALVHHAAISDMLTTLPWLTHVFWRETLVDAAIFREWVANLGSRDARSRVAHLFCELMARLDILGLVQDDHFHLPFTQVSIADACGLSTVHLNRIIQELRQRGLIEWKARTVTILQRKKLEELAEFSYDYLHQNDADRYSVRE